MHPTSQTAMQKFIDGYLNKGAALKVIEIGSRDPTSNNTLNASYRAMFNNPGWEYYGLDLAPGAGVDIVSEDPYHYPIADAAYDVVISGQTLEHVEDMHAFMRELARILKPGGRMCIIAPWSWTYHPFPVDCWRIMRDGMRFLLTKIAALDVLEVYEHGDDCVGIAKKKEEVVKGVDLNVDVAESMSNKETF